jgi:protein TonB
MLAIVGAHLEPLQLSIHSGGLTIVAVLERPPLVSEQSDGKIHSHATIKEPDRCILAISPPPVTDPKRHQLEPSRCELAKRTMSSEVEMQPIDVVVQSVSLPDFGLRSVETAVPGNTPLVSPRPATPARKTSLAVLPTLVESVEMPSVASATAEEAGATVDKLPQKLPNNPAPPYPTDAYVRRQQGRVLLEVRIDARGKVTAIRVSQSSSVSPLDQAALDAVEEWQFQPARRGGEAVAFTVTVPIRFVIRTTHQSASG